MPVALHLVSAMTAVRQPPAATSDLDRARALLANDPDEMDEEWLAEIIAAVRAEAKAEGWDDAVKALRDCYKDDRGIIADVYADWLATNRPSPSDGEGWVP
jgi:gamma-glutamyl:cysteine ligase YbdK (ATP-grasp superfamily)